MAMMGLPEELVGRVPLWRPRPARTDAGGRQILTGPAENEVGGGGGGGGAALTHNDIHALHIVSPCWSSQWACYWLWHCPWHANCLLPDGPAAADARDMLVSPTTPEAHAHCNARGGHYLYTSLAAWLQGCC